MDKAKGVKRIPIILDNEKYFYEKCNEQDRHANVTRAQPIIRERFIRGDYERNGLDHKRNKGLGKNLGNRGLVHVSDSEDSYEESGPVNRNLSNVTRAPPVKQERFIRGDYVRNGPDHKRNKRLGKNPGNKGHVHVYEESGPVNRNLSNVTWAQPVKWKRKRSIRGDYERNGLDHKRNKRLGILFANRGHVHVSDSEDSYEESGPVNMNRFNHVTEGQKGKCNKLQEKKNISVKIEEKNSDTDDDTSTEVEILDSDEVIKKGTTSAFVPSTIYRSDFGVSKASFDYRGRVLNVLKKPFDKEEYRRLSKEVKSYLANYPNLKMKLVEYRYKRLTRMTILRGFFYWLQNVVHDEAFQPWEDSQCLAVKPGE